MSDASPLLEVRDLRARFGEGERAVRAVEGVDLEIRAGEMVGLVGESGSGKTSVALSILGLLPGGGHLLPGSSVRLRGQELVGLPPRRLHRVRGREIAMIFQDAGSSLNPVVSVGKQIAEAMRVQGGMGRAEARAEVVERLREVGIPNPEERAHRYPHEFSGGMRQRAALAMALAARPALLLADEPTAALDVTLQAQILDLLENLRRRRGLAVLLISHDLGVVSRVCQRVSVLYGGRVMEEGFVDDALGAPSNPYTRGLVGCLPSTVPRRRKLPAIPGVVPEAGGWPAGCPFEPRCASAWDRCREEVPPLVRRSGDGQEGASWRSRCWLEVEPPPGPADSRSSPEGGQGAAPSSLEPPGSRDPTGTPPSVAGPTGEPLVRVRGLRVHFRGKGPWRGSRDPGPRAVRAVDGVDLAIREGETYGLVGESGCGKTTLARAVLGLVAPGEGEVRFDGMDPHAASGKERGGIRRRAQIVFQDPMGALNPRKTVGRALEEVLQVHGLAAGAEGRARRVAELLEAVGLRPADAERHPHAFSGGQRQRVGIARALAVEPEFMILDEPVSALDISVRAQILNLLLDLQSRLGLTYLFIAHDLSVVEHMSDRVGVMYAGRLVEEAPAEHFARGGSHPYTRALREAVPVLPGQKSGPPAQGCSQGFRPREALAEREGADEGIGLGGAAGEGAPPIGGCPYQGRCRDPRRDEGCRTAVPPLEEKEPGHGVACFKVRGPLRRASAPSLDSLEEPRHLGFPPEPGSED